MISPWQFALVSLAAWRAFHLLGRDTITDPIRRWFAVEAETDEMEARRQAFFDFLACPFCLGFWVALVWVAAFWLEPHWTVIVAVPFAVSAAVAVVQSVADALTD